MTTLNPRIETSEDQQVPSKLRNDMEFLESEYNKTGDYRNVLLSLLALRRATSSYSTTEPMKTTQAETIPIKSTGNPTIQAATLVIDDTELIDYYDDDVKSILTTSIPKTTKTHPTVFADILEKASIKSHKVSEAARTTNKSSSAGSQKTSQHVPRTA